jgi:hypothetical protein
MPSLFEQMQADAAGAPPAVSLFDQMRADAASPIKVQVVPPGPRPNGYMKGLNDISAAGAQLLTHALPDRAVSAVNRATKYVNDLPYIGPVTQALGMVPATAPELDTQIADTGKAYADALKASGHTGIDWQRGTGQAIGAAPLAAALPAAGPTMAARSGVGFLSGAVGGALQPVEHAGNFWVDKGVQTGLGGATGAVLSPLLGKVVDAAAQKITGYFANRADKAVDITSLERVLRQVASDAGQKWEDMSPQIQAQLRQQTMDALGGNGAKVNTAALVRKQDFLAEGMQPTLGQVTRDAGQFAQERNLRTMPGVGDPLLQRFMDQGKQLQDKFGAYSSDAKDSYLGGKQLAEALTAYDAKKSSAVTSAYQAARAAAGKDAEIPMHGIAQDYAAVLDSFGDKVPSGVRNQFQKYGLNPANPSNLKKLFTVEEADKLLKVINANQSNDPATNNALTQLRAAVKGAVTKDAGVDDVFSPARKAAAERFSLHDAVPALHAAATGSTAPDDFVRKFVVSGKTEEVQALAKVLKDGAPDAMQQARAQIGAHLQRSAFGENVAGDKAFSPERYAKALRDLGDTKLSAFYSPDEISQLHRLGRIGAYINSVPNASPVQSSNNWGAIMGVASKIPGIGAATGLIKGAKNIVDNQTGVGKALAANLPKAAAELPPEDIRLLARLLTLSSAAGGAAAAQQVK